jgi:hypothetical protein
MKRKDVLALIRVAGYHADQRSFIRLYAGNRISYQAATEAYHEGAKLKEAGMRCTCLECKEGKTQ